MPTFINAKRYTDKHTQRKRIYKTSYVMKFDVGVYNIQ